MSWIFLISAGLLEVIWAIGLKHNEGFTKPLSSLITLLAMGASFYLLSLALRSLPLGAAYAMWVGIGVLGTTLVGVVVFQETINLGKAMSVMLLVAGVVGLKIFSGS